MRRKTTLLNHHDWVWNKGNKSLSFPLIISAIITLLPLLIVSIAKGQEINPAYTFAYTEETNTITVQRTDTPETEHTNQPRTAYRLYYLHGVQTYQIQGDVQEREAIRIGTCSGEDCSQQKPERILIKINRENIPDAYYLEINQNNTVTTLAVTSTTLDSLSQTEERWLHTGEGLPRRQSTPTPETTPTPTVLLPEKEKSSQATPIKTTDADEITGTDGSSVIVVDTGIDGTTADGKTTFREALNKANSLPAGDIKKIVFCIPDGTGGDPTGLDGLLPVSERPCGTGPADSTYDSGTGRWTLNVSNTFASGLNRNNTHILANHRYNWLNPDDYPDPTAKQRIIMQLSQRFNMNADYIVLRGLKVIGPPSDSRNIVIGATTGTKVGGDGFLDRNVLFNPRGRVLWFISGSNDVEVLGNFLGIDDDGVTPQQPRGDMIFPLSEGPKNAKIGGSGWGRNYMGGGIRTMVLIGWGGDNNVVQNNYFGVGYDGVPLANTQNRDAIYIRRTNNTLFGGDRETEGNVIAGSLDTGLILRTANTNRIYGNRFINNRHGVYMRDASNVEIGDGTPEHANVMIGNTNALSFSRTELWQISD